MGENANGKLPSRVNTLWVFGLIYFSLTVFQLFSQYKRITPNRGLARQAQRRLESQLVTTANNPQFQERALPESSLSDKPATKARGIPKAILPALGHPSPHSLSACGAAGSVYRFFNSGPQQTVNAPNGIGSIERTLINPQVNNFAKLYLPIGRFYWPERELP